MLILSCLLPLMFSCSGQVKPFPEVLPGKWNVYSFKTEKGDPESKTLIAAKHLSNTVSYEFRENFTYRIESKAHPNGSEGRWAWNTSSQTLELNAGSEQQNIRILRYDDNTMAFETKSLEFGKVHTLLRKEQ